MSATDIVTLTPIGVFHCDARYPYDLPRQPAHAKEFENFGYVELFRNQGFEQAVEDLEGFSHVWLVFLFDRNAHWTPKVLPPRGSRNVGVFSTRAPYRPNPIGMSVVELDNVSTKPLRVNIRHHDLLNHTPILDIKPYIPADRIADARFGWLETAAKENTYSVDFDPLVYDRQAFIDQYCDVPCLWIFLREQLSCDPLRAARKRITDLGDGRYMIAYRTWRAIFGIDETQKHVTVYDITSGYTAEALNDPADPYDDKDAHRAYVAKYG